jgi:HEAT repeat protein
MSLEVDAVGPMLRDAVLAMAEQGRLAAIVEMLDLAPAAGRAVAAIEECLATPDHLRALLDEAAVDSREVCWMISKLGGEAAEPLLDALAGAETRARRRALLDHLGALGSAIGPAVAARLPGAPWYVQRNMLSLLEGMSELPEGFSAVPYASHSDARVRRQAVRVLFEQEAQRDAAVLLALRDRDDQTVRLGLGRALDSCPAGALQVIRERLSSNTLDAELELLAIRVVASVDDPAAVDCLLEYVVKSRGWFRGSRLTKGSPRALVALAGLSRRWASDPRVAAVLQRASRHPDPAVRAAAAPEECPA